MSYIWLCCMWQQDNHCMSIAGVGAGSVAAVLGYRLFAHIKVRVSVWKDPFASYNEGGYQVAQSLFAIGTGSWFGMGLMQGSPDLIPVAESDFIFAAIAEEMGLIYALCLIFDLCKLLCYVFVILQWKLEINFINWLHWDWEPATFSRCF